MKSIINSKLIYPLLDREAGFAAGQSGLSLTL